MPAKLDKSRPFGTVHGIAPYAYEQDGKQFLHDGTEYIDPAAAPAKTDPFGLKPAPAPAADLDLADFDEADDAEDPEEEDDLARMGNKDLRNVYKELTGDKLRVGIKNDKIRDIIRALRRGETPEAA